VISRREFLRVAAGLAPVLGGAGLVLSDLFRNVLFHEPGLAHALDLNDEMVRLAPRARYWTPQASGMVRCLLCPQGCVILAGGRGRCRARMNAGGELRSLVYGQPVSIHVDPIEKKPFYHYLPGAEAYSLATTGCPLKCKFCQNWQISQASPEDCRVPRRSPSWIALSAATRKARVIAFTYSEPAVFAEYLLDIAREAKRLGLRSTMVTCGFINQAPLADMCRALNAIKVDLKGYDASFYREVCGAELQPVLRGIRQIARSRVHLEIVNLVVPTLNDSDKMIQGLIDWVLGEVGPDVPLHFSRFHPDYQMLNLPATPVATLERAREMAMDRGMRYVYVGNVPGHPGNHTYCPFCKKLLIRRTAYFVQDIEIRNGRCGYCGRKIAGVWV
jgi:pyruvate formate lyase activating enzyme